MESAQAINQEACTYPPLESITRPGLDTKAAAYYLNRKEQTLRSWACSDNGPIRPRRINGRLAWPVDELRRVLGVSGGAQMGTVKTAMAQVAGEQ